MQDENTSAVVTMVASWAAGDGTRRRSFNHLDAQRLVNPLSVDAN